MFIACGALGCGSESLPAVPAAAPAPVLPQPLPPSPEPGLPPPQIVPPIPAAFVLDRLSGIELKRGELDPLVELGERLFPAYEEILADSGSEPWAVEGVLILIARAEGDRRRFVEPAVKRLTDPDPHVRRVAVSLLGEIGSRSEAAPVAAMLSPAPASDCVFQAARALARIGGERELAALDVWLVIHRDSHWHTQLYAHVTRFRDELKERLRKDARPDKK